MRSGVQATSTPGVATESLYHNELKKVPNGGRSLAYCALV